MRQNRSLPSYSQIFGALDFREVDEGRSVYSPAAYLAELLDLIRDTLGPDALITADRRSDITAVPLDAEHTFTERPYLEVVNRILRTLVGPDAHATMAELRAPFTMPFSLDRQRLAACLRHLRVDPVALYTLFAVDPKPDVVAREYLGLSADDAADSRRWSPTPVSWRAPGTGSRTRRRPTAWPTSRSSSGPPG
jgi:virulence plasmid A protein